MTDIPTIDPFIVIEEQRDGYIRYRDTQSGKRWEVHGTCDKRGNCLVGAVINGESITSLERARELAINYTGPDCPVTPSFEGCCPFTYVELEPNK